MTAVKKARNRKRKQFAELATAPATTRAAKIN